MTDVLERALPNNPEAEQAILGGIMLNPSLLHEVLAQLQPEDFYGRTPRTILEAMITLAQTGEQLEPLALAAELRKDGRLEAVGGVTTVLYLSHGIPRSDSLQHYIRIVREMASKRKLIKFANRVVELGMDGSVGLEEVMSSASDELYRLNLEHQLASRSPARSYMDVGLSVSETFDRWQAGDTVAVPTQIPELDARLNYGGLSAGDLVVLAARTSFGKSALALQIALSSARARIPVLIFSLEMSAERLFIRNLASTTRVPHYRIAPKTFLYNPGLADELRQAVPGVSGLPIRVDGTTRKLRPLGAVAREWHKQLPEEHKKRALLITDYMQLVDNKLERRSRNDEVAGISIELKGLAVELGIPVIGVSQLTRSPARDNRRPELADLRESGQLEQDADLVLFPWSEDGLKDDVVRQMKIYCPKQRGGQVGWEIPVDFDGDKQWFFTPTMYAQERGIVTPAMDFND